MVTDEWRAGGGGTTIVLLSVRKQDGAPPHSSPPPSGGMCDFNIGLMTSVAMGCRWIWLMCVVPAVAPLFKGPGARSERMMAVIGCLSGAVTVSAYGIATTSNEVIKGSRTTGEHAPVPHHAPPSNHAPSLEQKLWALEVLSATSVMALPALRSYMSLSTGAGAQGTVLCVIANIETFSQLYMPLLAGSVYSATVRTSLPGASFFVCGAFALVAFFLARALPPTTYRYVEAGGDGGGDGGDSQDVRQGPSEAGSDLLPSGFLRVPASTKG